MSSARRQKWPAKLLAELQSDLARKQQQADALQREQQRLQFTHFLIGHLVNLATELFAWLRATQPPGAAALAPDMDAQEQELLGQLCLLASHAPPGSCQLVNPYAPPPPPPQQQQQQPVSDAAACNESQSTGTACTASAQPPPATLAPPDDPFYLFREGIQQPPAPGVGPGVTPDDIRAYARATVRELAVALFQQQAGMLGEACQPHGSSSDGSGGSSGAAASAGSAQQALQQRLQQQRQQQGPVFDLVARHLQMIMTLSTCPHRELQEALLFSNHDTGEPVQGPDRSRHARVARQLRLAPSQTRMMVDGLAVFNRLLAPVSSQLQQQAAEPVAPSPAAAAAAASASASLSGSSGHCRASGLARASSDSPGGSASSLTASASAAAAAAGGLAAASAAAGSVRNTAAAGAALAAAAAGQQQQPQPPQRALDSGGDDADAAEAWLARLRGLLRKDWLVRMCMASFFAGCLSATQIAQMLVLMAPYHPAIPMIASVLAEDWLQQQGQQQQQGGMQQQGHAPPQQQQQVQRQPSSSTQQHGAAGSSGSGSR